MTEVDPPIPPIQPEEPWPTSIDYDPDGATIEGAVDGGRIVGYIGRDYPPDVAVIDDLLVSDEGKGKGTHLVKVFAREAIAHGARMLQTSIISRQAMRNRIRLFGAENIECVERRPDGSVWVLPITAEQAEASLTRVDEAADAYDAEGIPWPDDFSPGITTRTNLMNPDVRRRIGLPPIAAGLTEHATADPGMPAAGSAAAAPSGSVAEVHAQLVASVEMMRQLGAAVLGTTASLRESIERVQAELEGSSRGLESITALQEAVRRGEVTVEQLNRAIEDIRAYSQGGLS